MAPSATRILYAYGLFLMVGGITAFAMANFEARAKTAVIMGFGCGLTMWLCAYLGSSRPGFLTAGRYLATMFLTLFSWRGFKIVGVTEKQYLLYTFIVLSSGSAVALVALLLAPKAAAKTRATGSKASGTATKVE